MARARAVSAERVRKAKIGAAEFLLRDTRERNWGWFQRELIDFFAPLVGPYAVAVYVCLCHVVRGNEASLRVTQRELEGMWTRKGFRPALSRASIQRALRMLVQAGMIVEASPATKRIPAVYALVSLRELASVLRVGECDNLATIYEMQKERLRGERTKTGAQRGSLGASQKLLKSGGKACGKDVISTENPGPLEAPQSGERGPGEGLTPY